MMLDIWDQRRANLRFFMASKGESGPMTGRALSLRADIGANTVNKFLKGDTKTLSQASLEALAAALDLPSASYLDSSEPWTPERARLAKMISDLPGEEVSKMYREWAVRYPHLVESIPE